MFAHKLTLVPIKEMTDVLKVKHKESELRPGTWVRIKRGKYAMDLAQVSCYRVFLLYSVLCRKKNELETKPEFVRK